MIICITASDEMILEIYNAEIRQEKIFKINFKTMHSFVLLYFALPNKDRGRDNFITDVKSEEYVLTNISNFKILFSPISLQKKYIKPEM